MIAPIDTTEIISPTMRKLITNGTIPLVEATTEEEFKTYFKYNLEKFPHVRYRQWLEGQKRGVQIAAKQCPPVKLYRLVSDDRPCAVTGYKGDSESDARIVVAVLGEDHPQFVEPAMIKDASVELRD